LKHRGKEKGREAREDWEAREGRARDREKRELPREKCIGRSVV